MMGIRRWGKCPPKIIAAGLLAACFVSGQVAWAMVPADPAGRRPAARAPKVRTEVKNGWTYKFTMGPNGQKQYKSARLYETIGPVRYLKAEKTFRMTPKGRAVTSHTIYGINGKPKLSQAYSGTRGGGNVLASRNTNYLKHKDGFYAGKTVNYKAGRDGSRVVRNFERTKITKAGPVTTTYGPRGKPLAQVRPAKLNGKPASISYGWNGKRWVPEQRRRDDGKGPIQFLGPRGKVKALGTDVRTVKGSRVPFVVTDLGKDGLKETVWTSRMTKSGPVVYKAEVFGRKNGKPVSVGVFPVKNGKIYTP